MNFIIIVLIVLFSPLLGLAQLQNVKSFEDLKADRSNISTATIIDSSYFQNFVKAVENRSVNTEDFATFALAKAKAEADTAIFLISNTVNVTSPDTLKDVTAVVMHPQGRFNLTRKLVIDAPFYGDALQYFTGDLDSLEILSGRIPYVLTEWTGADPTDTSNDSAAIQSIVNAAPGSEIRFLEGVYKITSGRVTLSGSHGTVFRGVSKSKSIIDGGANNIGIGVGSDAQIEVDSSDNVVFINLRMENDGDAGILTARSCNNISVIGCTIYQDSTGTDTEALLFREITGRPYKGILVDGNNIIASVNAININVDAATPVQGFQLVNNIVRSKRANGIFKISEGATDGDIAHNYISGSGTANQGVNFSSGYHRIRFHHNTIDSVKTGIRIEETTATTPATDIIIESNTFRNITTTGISIRFVDTTLTNLIISKNIITASSTNSNGLGIDDTNTGRLINWAFLDNVISDFDSSGIQVRSDSGQVRGNVIQGSGDDVSIFFRNTVVGGNVAFNKLLQKTGTTVITNSGSGLQFKDNIGYVTSNSGTATVANGTTSIAVTHGLAITPAAGDIQVTPIEALSAASFWYVDTITSTQFTIHTNVPPTADVDFAWRISD